MYLLRIKFCSVTAFTWMSVSDTPKSRLETINFPGPAVVRAAGLNSWNLQVMFLHCRIMINNRYIESQINDAQNWLFSNKPAHLPCLAVGCPWKRSCCHWVFMFLPTDLRTNQVNEVQKQAVLQTFVTGRSYVLAGSHNRGNPPTSYTSYTKDGQ